MWEESNLKILEFENKTKPSDAYKEIELLNKLIRYWKKYI